MKKGPTLGIVASFIFDEDIFVKKYEDDKRKEKENQFLKPDTTLSAALNKLPAVWINAICKKLDIPAEGRKREKAKKIAGKLEEDLEEIVEKLPSDSLDAIKFILERDGWVKSGSITRRFGKEDPGWFWEEHPPEGTVSTLRVHGLVFVGRAGFKGRRYKIFSIPVELREKLREICGKQTELI
ncbi:hypothetical protein AKJ61_03000 [candidate division MSBL1 archaeon SCGC-AAA259B11]|uniref:Uncharacterized protein n=1 Tax=candidate division MSBL1 archaeon SCGC-AAA259B11 TaxID=1698260 RepID=A0A133U5E1_9EURY|nr:hypothetical protein AKJ61_03000 [candidate division MSBL1 archaeon SCGC-AAA259B11]